MSGKVLVLGSDTRAFLAVVRSLGRRGLEVHAAWCSRESPARRSRYLSRVHDLPPFSPYDLRWKEALVSLLKRETFDLLIPCEDPTLLPIRAHRVEFESLVRLALPEEEALAVTLDKIRSCTLARELGVPQPESRVVECLDDLQNLDLQGPLVLKPRTTFAYPVLTHRRHARIFPGRTSLRAFLEQTGMCEAVLVQEFFSGVGVGVEVLADRGEVLMAFQHERVHEPLRGGGSSYRRSTPLDPDLLEAARKLLGAVQYTGVAMVEFRRNPRTADWVFLEINGRFWGSLPLAVASGADFPYGLYRLLVFGDRHLRRDYRVGLYCRHLTLDLVWLRDYVRNLGSLPEFAPSPWRVLAEVGNLLRGVERSDTATWDDPGPAWAELSHLARAAVRKTLAGIRRVSLRFGPTRRVQAARLLRKLSQARTVLFVCRGNLCRSPFAEAYASRLLPSSVRVLSAGTRAMPGASSPPVAVAAAEAFGVDLTVHRATQLSAELLQEADVVITFDLAEAERIRQEHPDQARKVFLLGVLAGDQVEIPDPYGADPSVYRLAYERIAGTLRYVAHMVRAPAQGPEPEEVA